MKKRISITATPDEMSLKHMKFTYLGNGLNTKDDWAILAAQLDVCQQAANIPITSEDIMNEAFATIERDRIESLYYLEELEKKEEVLNQLAESRRELITRAKEIALEIYEREGTVSSPQVLAVLREENPFDVDPRFMGAVFRKGWLRVGWTTAGSHGRPVSVWKRDLSY